MFSSEASKIPGVLRYTLESDPIPDSITGDEECPQLVVMGTGNLTLCGLNPKTLSTLGLNLEVWVKTGGVGFGGVLMGFVMTGGNAFMVTGSGIVLAWKKWIYKGWVRGRLTAMCVCVLVCEGEEMRTEMLLQRVCALKMKLQPHKNQTRLMLNFGQYINLRKFNSPIFITFIIILLNRKNTQFF